MKKQTEMPCLKELDDIYEKTHKLNDANPNMETVNTLYSRLKAIEPQINAFTPEEEDWGAINAKSAALRDILFMKAYFKSCGIEVR